MEIACGYLAYSIAELGFCYHLGGGESMKQQQPTTDAMR
jgi:hypothetical protein